ncbi:Aste57867_2768 [Aphanomyces stellatus]|uniref:Aste57867_2768 protein n=1 Tax=Aphanomyces stellatus TaxID=120398 RepID=A0A485K887_9STRA|nr:hypothetical protein As57867_002761 [Aphanomyces stellatus]VFT79958.1 Aste57867_2768 [Aphanomyces stellatus]
MEKLRAVDFSQIDANETASAADMARKICTDKGWNPEEAVHLTLLDLLTECINRSNVRLAAAAPLPPPSVINRLDHEAAHRARGSSVQDVVQHAIATLPPITAVDLISVPSLKARLTSLRDAFPGPNFNHAVAVKANPIPSVLRIAQEMGFGAECASFSEVTHSLALGFPPRSVVYDSPCKTTSELTAALRQGCYINLDNLEEIAKVEAIFATIYGTGAPVPPLHDAQIGLRINPIVGGGTIASTSTATSTSKFGLPWTPETESHLLALFEAHAWLQGLHVHVGSQGCAVDLLVAGAKRAVDFALLVHAHLGRRQVRVLDIGGGLPTVYDGLRHSDLSYADYAARLRAHVPAVFSFFVMTEFGRSIFVKPGITLTKVESVKQWAGQNTSVVHVGANQFLRTAYLPQMWPHSFSVFTPNGVLKEGPMVCQDIAGPLCFSGDFLARDVWLPQIQAGDYVVVHDTGGYTQSMYSKYNSRPSSAVYGYESSSPPALTLFKPEETIDAVLAFWGP